MSDADLCLFSLCPLCMCLAGAGNVCVVGVGGSMVGAPGRSCCVFGRVVSFWARLCSTS